MLGVLKFLLYSPLIDKLLECSKAIPNPNRIEMDTFEHVLSVINSEKFQDIEKYWSMMPLVECATKSNKLNKSVHGLYALKHPKYGIIYIGKGKPIFKRVLSHYKATQGIEKAPAWKQFFSKKNNCKK